METVEHHASSRTGTDPLIGTIGWWDWWSEYRERCFPATNWKWLPLRGEGKGVVATIRVITAGDDADTRSLLALVFNGEGDFAVVGEARTAADITVALAERAADVVLVDLDSAPVGTAAAVWAARQLETRATFVGMRGGDAADPFLSGLMDTVVSKDSPIGDLTAQLRARALQQTVPREPSTEALAAQNDGSATEGIALEIDGCENEPVERGNARRSGIRVLLVAGWLVALIALVNYWLPAAYDPQTGLYVVQPLLWLSLAALAWLAWWREKGKVAPPFSIRLTALAALIGLFQFGVLYLSGLDSGAGYPPFTYSASLAALNAWFVLTRLIGLELARRYLLVALRSYAVWLGPLVAWLLLAAATLPLMSLLQPMGYEDAIRSSTSAVLPATTESLLSTYLCAVGGPVPAIAYRLVWQSFQWVWPLIPILDWRLAALFNTATPVFGLLVVSVLKGSHGTRAGTAPGAPRSGMHSTGRAALR